MAIANAQAPSQNQYSPMALLLPQTLSQNIPNRAALPQELSSAPSSMPIPSPTSLFNPSSPSSPTSQQNPVPILTPSTPYSTAWSAPSQIQPSSLPVQNSPSTPMSIHAHPLPPPSQQSLPTALHPMHIPESSSVPVRLLENGLPPPPPPCQPYTTMQGSTGTNGYGQIASLQGHPRITVASGFPALTAIQRTNNNRLDHASHSLPRNARKEKKPRGKAIRPPSLARRDRGPNIEDCINIAVGGVEVITIDVLVYLPLPPKAIINHHRLPSQPIFYDINKDSFCMVLNALGLLHQYSNLPTSTMVFDLLSDITIKLRDQYSLPLLSSSLPLAPRELLPLHLMGFSNYGRTNGSYSTSKLRPMSYESNTTIRDLLSSHSTYVVPKLVITKDNHFQLHTIIRAYPLEANISLAQVYLGSDESIRPHRCLSKRFYSMFRHDSDANLNVHALDEEEMEESCDELDNNEDSDEEDSRVVAQSLTSEQRSSDLSTEMSRGASMDHDPQHAIDGSTSSTSQPRLAFTSAAGIHSISSKLWEEDWISPSPLASIPEFFDHERTLAIFQIVAEVNRGGSECAGFEVKGANDQEMALEFIKLMQASVRSQDWSKILSPYWHFMCIDNQDNYISSGPGCEQSTMTEVFKQFFDAREDEFCMPLFESYTTLQSADIQISPDKRRELVLFGAVTALALVYGQYPGHLNPLLLIYLLNNCNLSCLHRDLVSSYLPSISEMLDRWLNMGPSDSIVDFAAHFASYHNIQVGVLSGRSETGHRMLAWEMLHSVVVGPVGIDNAYFEAFIEGFQLPCSTGVDLVDIVRSFSGGAEEFVRTAEASSILDFNSLHIRFLCSISEHSLHELANAFSIAGHNFAGKIFEEVFKEFLTGIGAPCPQLLEDAKSRLSIEVNASLSGLQSPTFRMRLMCWAVTGATRTLRDGNPIRIILVEDSDPCYLPATSDPDSRRAYILSGCCSFKTCTRTMRIPVSHLIYLLTQSYDSTTEIKDAQAAVHNWLLIQMLESAGAYTTV
ncbi:hypothetical protein C8R41DRAFT_914098 [Lentinula lateritia]|uniref:HECT domain-containing protein n=1 Tax=Lentinula lateritia TaxID=40482 RepID=A0ABQ8VY91_9AGAR|nr:hypothetical protein C8R41DRAFT_914098 [Lentinula lateritia]